MASNLERLYLIGLPGSGKSTVAPLLAQRLGWSALDLDDAIAAETGTTITALLAQGEAQFRAHESAALRAAVQRTALVIATGGGAILDAANRALMQASGTIVALQVSPAIAAQRLAAPDIPIRPLLQGDQLARLRQLQQERAPLYATAAFTVDTAARAPVAVVDHIIAALVARGLFPAGLEAPDEIVVPLARQSYTIAVGQGVMGRLPEYITALGLPPRLTIITDTIVAGLYLDGVLARMEHAGIVARHIIVPAGEATKSMATLTAIYDVLLAAQHERGDTIVALGGGVVGDLAGFAAATYLRGVPLVQVPTTLLAQVDAAIGGKTGINHPAAKNSIGAFYQPRAVLIDPAALLTLDERTYREGWGEIVKYGMVLDGDLFALLEAQAAILSERALPALAPIIVRCARLKAAIVAADEHESDQRLLLNYGHTIGHALEAATGYGTLLHGEAVFLGMAIEARLAQQVGLLTEADVARQDRLIARFFLPERDILSGITPQSVLAATHLDKKTQAGLVRYVLPTTVGAAAIAPPISDDLVRKTLATWLGSR